MTPYYSDDAVTIYHGDCREVIPQLVMVDAVVTDPPYGVGKSYDNWDDAGGPEYWAMIRDVVTSCRVLTPVVAMTHRVLALQHLTDWDWVCGWIKRNQQMRLFSRPVLPTWEPIIVWGLIGHKGAHRPDCFKVDAIQPSTIPGGHPFPKPIGLMIELVEWLTAPGDRVLDPFMGSGTTLRAAKDLGRKAIGIEISEHYCEIAARRLAQEVLRFDDAAS